MTFTPQFRITNDIMAALVKIERTRGFFEAEHLLDLNGLSVKEFERLFPRNEQTNSAARTQIFA